MCIRDRGRAALQSGGKTHADKGRMCDRYGGGRCGSGFKAAHTHAVTLRAQQADRHETWQDAEDGVSQFQAADTVNIGPMAGYAGKRRKYDT